MDQIETLKGAIGLCEIFFTVLDHQPFEQVFTTIANKLRGAAETCIASFKADMLTVQSSQASLDQVLASTDPMAIRLLQSLEVLHGWSSMFCRLIERFESKQYSNFDVIIRSDDLAQVYIQILSLTAN